MGNQITSLTLRHPGLTLRHPSLNLRHPGARRERSLTPHPANLDTQCDLCLITFRSSIAFEDLRGGMARGGAVIARTKSAKMGSARSCGSCSHRVEDQRRGNRFTHSSQAPVDNQFVRFPRRSSALGSGLQRPSVLAWVRGGLTSHRAPC